MGKGCVSRGFNHATFEHVVFDQQSTCYEVEALVVLVLVSKYAEMGPCLPNANALSRTPRPSPNKERVKGGERESIDRRAAIISSHGTTPQIFHFDNLII